MKTSILLFLMTLFSFSIGHGQVGGPIEGQYLVMLKESVAVPVVMQENASEDREAAYALNDDKRQQNLQLLANVRNAVALPANKVVAEYADVVVGFTAQLSGSEIAKLVQHPAVEGVYQDYYISVEPASDQGVPEEFSPNNQTTPCAISNAGGSVDGSSKAALIWILDTGIDLDHPDLNVHTTAPMAKSFIVGQLVDDGNGHGTHVAGIAAAKNNNIGTVGVSAGAKVVPVKIMPNSGSGGSITTVVQGLNHVATYDKPNDVVNMSIGFYPLLNCENASLPLRNAVRNLGNSGTWVCMASGNHQNSASLCAPGCINGNKVFTVGAMSCFQSCYTGPNWGAETVDWVATGHMVYSTYKNGGYATLTGTSQASPVVAGIIHARGGAPVWSSMISCGNSVVPPASYKKARRI